MRENENNSINNEAKVLGDEDQSSTLHETMPQMLDENSEQNNDGVDLNKEDPDELSAAEIQAQLDAIAQDKTLTHSAKRLANNGKIRFMVLGGLSATILVGVIGYSAISAMSKPPEESVPGEVAIPRTNAAASAIVTPEQAEYIKNQQDQQGAEAEKKGDTYIAGFVTERENEDEDLLPPSQPGLVGTETIIIKQFFDKQGNAYTAEKAAQLAAQGVQIEGVTIGSGSVSDPNVNTKSTVANNSKDKQLEEPKEEIQPYVVNPYTPKSNSETSAKSEFTEAETEKLDKSVKDVQAWNDEYLALRQKKAKLVDQKTQHAFESQISSLTKALKPASDSKDKTGGFSRIHYQQQIISVANDSVAKVEDSSPQTAFKPVIYAGESVRAILKNEVNTDNGTEVIATLLQGPMKGATLMGNVNITQGNIQFNFNRLLRKGKGEINISGIARQIGNNSSGMADDINKHYLKRYSALALSTALGGVGAAYEQTAGTTSNITNTAVVTESTDPTKDRIVGNIVGELGDEMSDEIKKVERTPTTYITHSGKIFNVFFNQNVLDTAVINK